MNHREDPEGIEADGIGQIEEFDHVHPALAALYARNPGLLLAQCVRKFLLPQAMSLALGDQ